MNQDIDRAAQKAGIADHFTAIDGSQQFTSIETKINLLTAMADDTSYPLANDPSPVKAAYVFRTGQPNQIPLNKIQTLRWQLTCEDASQFQGSIDESSLVVLPDNLPLGYHSLRLENNGEHWQSRIIIAPLHCFEPPALVNKQKIWGLSLQLYTVRSENNWGIGDFGDLLNIINQIGSRDGAFIGLNPIHALYPGNANSASPYSPSSRQWLNILYIDINQVSEFNHSQAAQTWWQSELTQQKLYYARHSEWVDYPTVTSLKLEALQFCFDEFLQGHDSLRQQSFNDFVTQQGASLQQQATYDALQLSLNRQHDNLWGWPVWPSEYQDYDSDSVRQFSQNHQKQIQFFCWLQWLAQQQFEHCHQLCQQYNMPIGLYRDLAVGVSEGSAEVWGDKTLYCLQASIGAPPDPLGPLGQNWGLPPINPHTLQRRAYQPFIDLLRANMANCGAIRIDHVMSLLRLWWIPYHQTSAQGAYVAYPVDELFAILALESQRHQCLVIGEDLGTVPDEIVDKLSQNKVYSYRVLYFQHGGKNDFFLPEDYPQHAMATINTHDLPTLRGFWLSNDLTLGHALKLYPDRHKLYSLYREREATKRGLLHTLRYAGYQLEEDENISLTLPMSDELSLAILRYMASSHSLLLGIQLEDLLGMLLPVNIPGTSNQYANWRRKLNLSLDAMFNHEHINHLLNEVNQIRKALNI